MDLVGDQQEVVYHKADVVYDHSGNRVWCEVCKVFVMKFHSATIVHWANVEALKGKNG